MTEPHQYRLHPDIAKQALRDKLQDMTICKNLDDVVVQEETIYGPRIFTLRELILRATETPLPNK